MLGTVYVLVDRDHGRFKVGWTGGDPEKRCRAIATAAGIELELIASYPGTRADEAAAHRDLAPWHIMGEWFRQTPEVVDWITRDEALGYLGRWGAYMSEHFPERPLHRTDGLRA